MWYRGFQTRSHSPQKLQCQLWYTLFHTATTETTSPQYTDSVAFKKCPVCCCWDAVEVRDTNKNGSFFSVRVPGG